MQIEQCSCMHFFWRLGRGSRLSSALVCILYINWVMGGNTALLSSVAFLAQFLKLHIILVSFGGRGFRIIRYHEYRF